MPVTRRRTYTVVALLLLAIVGIAVYDTTGWARFEGPVGGVQIDRARPDVLIRTRSLSALPRDLLKVPLAHDLLSEDFVFYYEEHPDRLGLAGALRRIAYEHQLTWRDKVLAWVLDQPAEIALWRGPKGALDYWIMSMSREELTKLLQEAAAIAMKDRQLTLCPPISVDGDTTAVYALAYSPSRTLLIAARRDRVVILSEPGLLLDAAGAPQAGAAAVVAKLLSTDEQQQAVYRNAFQLGAATADHSIAVRTHYLSFGYQHFFPGIEALRFDFGAERWTTQVLLDTQRLPEKSLEDRELWAGVPADPGACALLPVDWTQGRGPLKRVPNPRWGKPVDLVAELSGPAAICWYADGRVHTPLVAATLLRPRADLGPSLDSLFAWSIAKPAKAEVTVHRPRTNTDEAVCQRQLTVPYAAIGANGRPEPGTLQVTLAQKGRHLFFSPDAAQVERALATVGKRYPSVGETLPAEGVTLAVLSPKALRAIGEKEALVMLPSGDEPVFRAAAEQKLLPRLEAIAKYPPYRLVLSARPATGRHWEPVEWQKLTP